MYLEHFGLSEAPFRITPHTEFFFTGANRGTTLDALLYAITHDEGIVKVSGEVGSGKTMLCRVLMERLPAHVVIVYLANPSLSRDDILFAIADELELGIPDGVRAAVVLRTLQDRLIQLYAEGHQVVVLIDEAHAMPQETLEEIRLLSNLETNRHKLLQLVLFGQPELNEILARPDMRQLKERITHNFNLEPLPRDDIAHYLDFRMRAAGYRGPELFSPAAIKLIAKASEGLTRRINILADKALLAAFAENAHQVTPARVKAAIRDSEFGRRQPGIGRLAVALGVSATVLSLGIGTLYWQQAHEARPPAPTAMADGGAATASPTPAVPPPPPTTVTTDASAAAGNPASAAAPAEPQETAPPPAARPPDAASVPPAVPPEIPVTPQTVAATAAAAQVPATDSAEARLGRLTRRQLADTRQWLVSAEDERWFIQLLATDTDRSDYAESFVSRAIRLLPADQVRVYTADKDGRRRLGVIYGDFGSREAALQEIRQLPNELRSYRPFPRQVRRLR